MREWLRVEDKKPTPGEYFVAISDAGQLRLNQCRRDGTYESAWTGGDDAGWFVYWMPIPSPPDDLDRVLDNRSKECYQEMMGREKFYA